MKMNRTTDRHCVDSLPGDGSRIVVDNVPRYQRPGPVLRLSALVCAASSPTAGTKLRGSVHGAQKIWKYPDSKDQGNVVKSFQFVCIFWGISESHSHAHKPRGEEGKRGGSRKGGVR